MPASLPACLPRPPARYEGAYVRIELVGVQGRNKFRCGANPQARFLEGSYYGNCLCFFPFVPTAWIRLWHATILQVLGLSLSCGAPVPVPVPLPFRRCLLVLVRGWTMTTTNTNNNLGWRIGQEAVWTYSHVSLIVRFSQCDQLVTRAARRRGAACVGRRTTTTRAARSDVDWEASSLHT